MHVTASKDGMLLVFMGYYIDSSNTWMVGCMMVLKDGSLVVAKGQAIGTLYKTHVEVNSDSLNAAEDEASPNLWHKRLGHMSEKGLQILAKKSLIPFAKNAKLNPCDNCLFGKHHRVAFHSSSRRQSELLSRLHSDVCDPIEVESLGGRKYFLTETGKKLKCLRTDNGGEYTSKEFEAYCATHSIRQEKTVLGTPQHNAVAERMNRTIVEKVRCMLKMTKLPKPFWEEAVLVACYLINRSPSVPLNFQIPEEVWSGREISYSHLRVFGCKAFAHVSKEHRQKLDDKATPCIFIGYGDEEFGYRFWDLKNKKVIRSRDAVFQEGQTFEDFGQPAKPKVDDVSEIIPNPAPSQHATDEEELPQHAVNNVELQDGFLEEEDPEAEGIEQGEPQPPSPETVVPQLRRSTREFKPSTKYPASKYILLTNEGEPESGKLVKYKARLVVKGFGQKKGIDFDEIFSPVVKMTSIRVVLGLVASLNLELEQMDVKTAFLHGDLKEEIYMEQPEGFEVKGKENLVCRLKKSLYGLKQAPRQWYKKFDSFMVGHEYKKTATDQCVYVRKFPGGNFIILPLYVDDMLIVGQDSTTIRSLKKELSHYELLFYPRYHLDQSSLLCRKPLLAKPMVMDVYQDYLLVTYRPFDVHIFHVKLSGELTPSSSLDLQLSTVRELSIMTAKSHPAAMRFILDQLSREHVSKNQISTPSDLLGKEPVRCLILRANGELSLLDLDDGRERELTDSVELFWVTCGQSEEKTNLIEEVSWLDYGHRGMQVSTHLSRKISCSLDPELEFDREVYPLGLLPNAGVVVGVSQRMSFSACTEFPCFEPTPQAQTILHCLLRHLLQRDKSEEALLLAQLSAQKPHFSHCLEWLLFTVFEAEISKQSANKNQVFVPKHGTNSSLLEKTCDLIKNFPEYFDVVVSVARKTDGRHCADLFSAAGRSTELFEQCFQLDGTGQQLAMYFVIAKLEGPAVSQYCALRLLQAALDESLYELAGELVRFLPRSGREYEPSATDSDKLSPRFLSYFLFPSSYRRQSFDLKSPSFKEKNAHVASVKNILESHASYLMSGKELSKLVAFVKGTQFDLVEYLQRERYGSARLENFASGLELIGQKLQMGTLQSRLDAEFLLAHMCSVEFKEWIVVQATLLRRSEVLFDLFHHDMRLWKAYSVTLESHPAFAEYQDLLEALQEKLSSTESLEEK
ncbi:unnamed protein product [Camellia sinensis]